MSSSPTNGDQSAAAATVVAVTMPQMGVSVAEGTIVEWRAQPGDRVAADETICEVSTDKIDVEIPAPTAGMLTKHLAEVGETVAVGAPIAEIDTSSGAEADRAPETEPVEGDRSHFYSPVVRRIAEEHDIDLSEVKGSGVGGRIRKQDLLEHLAAERPAGNGSSRPLHTESPYRPEPGAAAPTEPADHEAATGAPANASDLIGPTTDEPMSPVRRRTAERMVASRRTAAHCTTVIEVDFSAVAEARAELEGAMAERGVKLTYLGFACAATIEALGAHPILNASVEGERIVYHGDVNLGIAVATDGGLIVPVIRKAQRLSLEGLAAAIADLAERARSGRLEPDDVHGGTFTITNPGQFGSVLATPIINQPQVAILDLEAVVRRPVVIDGDAIAVRPIANLCLSWDHRALDGVEAARFLADIKARLENLEASR